MREASVDSVVTDPPYELGFMGKDWDKTGIAFKVNTWREVLRVLKPGGHMVAFGAPKNAHRLTCAIEDAGFEIRDVVMWLFGTGFPKSHNLPGGFGTALKPAYEPVILARKPLIGTVAENVLKHGTGALNIDGCRVEAEANRAWRQPSGIGVALSGSVDGSLRNEIEDRSNLGRWPANIIHDGSDEVVGAFPESKDGVAIQRNRDGEVHNEIYGAYRKPARPDVGYGGGGSAARFFYCAKASKKDRAGSKHPTVKPIALMSYLCRLITPPGGVILDPFAGSGTTGQAAIEEGFGIILCEKEEKFVVDIERRLSA